MLASRGVCLGFNRVLRRCYRFSYTVGLTMSMTAKLAMIKAAAMKVTRKMLPLLAGNLPRMIQYYGSTSVRLSSWERFEESPQGNLTWLSKYLLPPTRRTIIDITRKVAPSGFPTCLRRTVLSSVGERPSLCSIVVLSLNNWVIATPMDANASEVRSQAKNVRSGEQSNPQITAW